MPIATFRFGHRGGEKAKDALAAVREIVAELDGDTRAIQAEFESSEFTVTVQQVRRTDDGMGLQITFAMDQPPRRADSVKSIYDELKLMENVARIYIHYRVSQKLGDVYWDKTNGIEKDYDIESTKGFIVRTQASNGGFSWLTLLLGAAAASYAWNFAAANAFVMSLAQSSGAL